MIEKRNERLNPDKPDSLVRADGARYVSDEQLFREMGIEKEIKSGD